MEEKFKGMKAEDLFLQIMKKREELRIPDKEFSELPAIKKLCLKKECEKRGFFLFRLFAGFALVCALVTIFGSHPISFAAARIWLLLRGPDIENEICVLNMPAEIQNMFMPPVECSMCQNLTQVEKVTNISPEEFENRFAYSGVPVVVSDGAVNWTAMETFSFDFFRQLYLEQDVEEQCQFFPYQTDFHNLYEVLAMDEERASKPWYIGWSNCDWKIGNILRQHYHRPYFLPLLAESTNIDWIFMGTSGYGAHMHIDHVNNPSWQAQIRGEKLWTLEPVPECYGVCRTLEVLVQPGEVVVLDTNRWYHKTLITGSDMSITIGSEYD